MIVREWIADCYGCEAELDEPEGLEATLRRGATLVGATVLGQCCTRYQPIGLTVFLPLAESHMMVSTWPELRFAIVSVLLCNEAMDPEVVVQAALAHLRPSSTRVHKIEHRVVGEQAAPPAV